MPEEVRSSIQWDSSSNPISVSDINRQNSGYKILVIDTNSDTPMFLPLSVLASRFLYKNENDEFTGNNLTVSSNSSLILNKDLKVNTGGNSVTINSVSAPSTSPEFNGISHFSNPRLKVTGDLEITGSSLFRDASVYSDGSNMSSDLSVIKDANNLVIGAGASGNSYPQQPTLAVKLHTEELTRITGVGINTVYGINTKSLSTFIGLKQSNTTSELVPTLFAQYYDSSANKDERFWYPFLVSGQSALPRNNVAVKYDSNWYRSNMIDVNVVSSDDRLKTRTKDSNYTLDQICSIPIFEFYYNEDDTKKLQIGTSAQSLREVEPLLVYGEESEKSYLSVEYGKLALIAIKGIQLLKEENEKLKMELDELKDLIKNK